MDERPVWSGASPEGEPLERAGKTVARWGYARLRAHIRSMLHQRAVPVLLVMACALGVIAAAALASDDSSPPPELFDPDAPAVRHAIEAAQQQQSEAEAYRDSSAGRAEREASQDAFTDQPDDQALATAREEFPELVASPPLRWPPLEDDQDVTRYLSPTSAIVEDADGKRAVLESDLPLRGETPTGDRAPLDMALSDQGDTFEPKSTVQPVELPDRSEADVRFPEQDVAIGLLGAEPTAAKLASGKVFFANASRRRRPGARAHSYGCGDLAPPAVAG